MSTINRRQFITAMVTTPAAMALGSTLQTGPAEAKVSRHHICLVHGAWHGGWAWTRLAPLLEEAGFQVSHPDLSGLGANHHRQSPEIGLHVHGQDLLNHLFFNDITNAVVVGHSYGGCVLSEALAGDRDGRISHAVYLDALIPGKGEALASFIPPQAKEKFETAAASGGMIPPRPPESWEKIWGLTGEAADFAGPRLKPMSARCFTEKVQADPFAKTVRRTYLRCIQNKNPLFDKFASQAKTDQRFTYGEIEGPHDVMVTDPALCRDRILEVL